MFKFMSAVALMVCCSTGFCQNGSHPSPPPTPEPVAPPTPIIVEGSGYTDYYGGGYVASSYQAYDAVTEAKAAKMVFFKCDAGKEFKEMENIQGLELSSFSAMNGHIVFEWAKSDGGKRFRVESKMSQEALAALAYKMIDQSREASSEVRVMLFQKAAEVMAASKR